MCSVTFHFQIHVPRNEWGKPGRINKRSQHVQQTRCLLVKRRQLSSWATQVTFSNAFCTSLSPMCMENDACEHEQLGAGSKLWKTFPPELRYCNISLAWLLPALTLWPAPASVYVQESCQELLYLHSTFSSDPGDVKGQEAPLSAQGIDSPLHAELGGNGHLAASPHKAAVCCTVIRETKIQVPLF